MPEGRWPLVLAGVTVLGVYAWLVSWYWFVGDDAFISFRYAQKLVAGHGLVFNPGEAVEGYTNLSWVLLVAAGMAVGIDPEVLAPTVGVMSGVAVLVLLWRVERLRVGGVAALLAPACLAVNRSFAGWSTGGLATMFFTLLTLAVVVLFIAERERAEARPWGSAALLALACLTRPDGYVLLGAVGLLYAGGVLGGRWRRGPALMWLAVAVVPVAVHVSWRLHTYGYPLPNTFYAKVSGLWLAQSGVWFWRILTEYLIVLVLPGLVVLWGLRRQLRVAVPAVVLGVFCAYLLYVGGDRMEYRLLVTVVPLFYWLAAQAVSRLIDMGWQWAAAGMVAVLLIGSALPNVVVPERGKDGIATLEGIERYARTRTLQGKHLKKLVESGVLRGDELLAVTGAGAVPYFSELPTLDVLGLNDAHIAHLDVDERGLIGHEKMPPQSYLEARGVAILDVRNQLIAWGGCKSGGAIELPFYTGAVMCVEAGGKRMEFATLLPAEEAAAVFAGFTEVGGL